MNQKEIKSYKGKLIRLTYNGNNKKIQVGKITAVTFDHVLFKINNEYEISIKFEKIENIEPLKTFNYYLRDVKRLIRENKPNFALNAIEHMNTLFNLKSQKNVLKSLKKVCVEMMYKKVPMDEIELQSKLDKIMSN